MTPPPPIKRTPSRPGQYAYAPDEEEPTRPDGMADVAMSTIISISRLHCTDDRKRIARLLTAWQGMSTDQRVLFEALAAELIRG